MTLERKSSPKNDFAKDTRHNELYVCLATGRVDVGVLPDIKFVSRDSSDDLAVRAKARKSAGSGRARETTCTRVRVHVFYFRLNSHMYIKMHPTSFDALRSTKQIPRLISAASASATNEEDCRDFFFS